MKFILDFKPHELDRNAVRQVGTFLGSLLAGFRSGVEHADDFHAAAQKFRAMGKDTDTFQGSPDLEDSDPVTLGPEAGFLQGFQVDPPGYGRKGQPQQKGGFCVGKMPPPENAPEGMQGVFETEKGTVKFMVRHGGIWHEIDRIVSVPQPEPSGVDELEGPKLDRLHSEPLSDVPNGFAQASGVPGESQSYDVRPRPTTVDPFAPTGELPKIDPFSQPAPQVQPQGFTPISEKWGELFGHLPAGTPFSDQLQAWVLYWLQHGHDPRYTTQIMRAFEDNGSLWRWVRDMGGLVKAVAEICRVDIGQTLPEPHLGVWTCLTQTDGQPTTYKDVLLAAIATAGAVPVTTKEFAHALQGVYPPGAGVSDVEQGRQIWGAADTEFRNHPSWKTAR